MLPILLLAMAQLAGEAAPVHDGGICAGLSWVRLLPGEQVTVQRGPDFDIMRFKRQGTATGREWGLYTGGAAQVRGDGPRLLRRDGVEVRRATKGGTFRGYLARKGDAQNHFFGSVFDGSASDRAFFDRIDFGARGQRLCAEDRYGE